MNEAFDKKVKKIRTKGTAHAIVELIQGVSIEELLSDVFVQTRNETAQKLIKMYEKQLVLAKIKPEDFKQNLHLFYKQTTQFIKKNKLYKEFFQFFYFMFSSLSLKNLNIRSSDVYMDLLYQQFNYFTLYPNIVYGLTIEGKPMIKKEPFPYLDMPLIEAKPNTITEKEHFALYRKYKYPIYTEADLDLYIANDRLTTNMVLHLSNFINEKTPFIVPQKYYSMAQGLDILQPKVPTSVYRQILEQRHFFLPTRGVKAVFTNTLGIKEVYFQEIFNDERIILLYKVTTFDDGEFSGFYDTRLQFFYSPWEDSNGERFHYALENFILEGYLYLTTDVKEREKDLSLDFERRLMVNEDHPFLPTIHFFYDTESITSKGLAPHYRKFDKNLYQETMTRINPSIRKLPIGAKASEDARKLAEQYGYSIRPGETFVRPFDKKVYHKGD